jgi:N-carbamoyl-L-amino-acid hydrolase
VILKAEAGRLEAEIEELSAFSEHPAPAVTRVLFSPEDLKARAWLKALCGRAGLETRFDAAGNFFARWRGTEPGLPALATGSHLDAIPNAGKYDGVAGVLGGLEAIRMLRAAGAKLRHSVELILFTSEEPTRFGLGCLGSRLLAGVLDPGRADALRDGDGKTLREWRASAGCAEGDLASVRLPRGHFAAFLELHIEQGPLLEREGLDIGVVEKIAAPSALRVKLKGEGGHAGAVLMPDRHDAGLGGAEIALAVERLAKECGSPDCVGTTGIFRLLPGAINSVPCEALLEIDIRDTRLASRDWVLEALKKEIAAVAARRGLAHEIEMISADPPALCDGRLVETVEQAAREAGARSRRMVSRAYHDSLFMAQVAPTAMLFIPCRKGWSHRPDEYASPEHMAKGAEVLARSLAAADSLF